MSEKNIHQIVQSEITYTAVDPSPASIFTLSEIKSGGKKKKSVMF